MIGFRRGPPIWLVVCATLAIGDQAKAQTFEHDGSWAQSQVDYLSTIGVTEIPVSLNLKTGQVAFFVQSATPTIKGNCLSPSALAYSEIDDGLPKVTVCANNIQYIYRSLSPYLYTQFYDHDVVNLYAEEYRSLIYEVAVKNRRYFRGDAAALLHICDYGLFIYLKKNAMTKTLCYFVDRPSEADAQLSELVDHNKLTGFRRQDPHALSSDSAEANRLYRAVATTTMTIILRYAILHEIGHLQHGDLLSPTNELCAQLKKETAADNFAERTMLHNNLISSSDDLLVARLAWAITSARLSSGRAGEQLGDETATERVLATVGQASRILDQVRRAQPVLADQVERGFGGIATLAPIFDQLRHTDHCH